MFKSILIAFFIVCQFSAQANDESIASLEQWAYELQQSNLTVERRAELYGLQASEALRRCRKYIAGWEPHFDPKTGLVPRNLKNSKFLWNGKDAAADHYCFMVLTSSLTDQALYEGKMLDILQTERSIATQSRGLPADFDFSEQAFVKDPQPLDELIFAGSEYAKDGLMPITEWLGQTPWSDRMIEMVESIMAQSEFRTPFGNIPSNNIEVNGEMMQVLSRLYFREDHPAYLDMACRIADFYLLGENHPTRNAEKLELRDHNCELISGLTEVYVACAYARKEKWQDYRQPMHHMLDDILRVAVNKHGLMYQTVNPKTGDVIKDTIHDNWGYTYNGFYSVFLIDGVERYRQACLKPLQNLKEHYGEFPWQGWSMDGIADSVEGCINLFNREPDVSGGVKDWIDANMNRMLKMQQPDGVVEGWYGDGNFARTSIMWALMKQQGLTIQPWQAEVKLGAVVEGGQLIFVIRSEVDWEGWVRFDVPRHRVNMKLPLDYPRINQFPEWYTVETAQDYMLNGEIITGEDLAAGIPVQLAAGEKKVFTVQSK